MKRIIRQSYERIAPRYLAWAESVRVEERSKYTQQLLEKVPSGSRVLDLGCGPGGSTTRALAERFRLVGVDICWANLQLAAASVPNALFLLADMAEVEFRPGSFDAVAAFYSLIHVPRETQAHVITRIGQWVRPDGLLTLSLGVGDVELDSDNDWLGAPMYWSSYNPQRNRRIVEDGGFRVISDREEVAEEFGQPITFQWIVARRLARGDEEPVPRRLGAYSTPGNDASPCGGAVHARPRRTPPGSERTGRRRGTEVIHGSDR